MSGKHSNPNRGLQYLHETPGHGPYVYYQRLREDHYYPSLATKVNARLERQISELSNLQYISNFFGNLARNEVQNEIDLLTQKFGHKIEGYYDSHPNFAKDLINALNKCLGIKEIYERNLALILNTKGQKNIITWFPDYFKKAWDEKAAAMLDEGIDSFQKGQYPDLQTAVGAAVDSNLNSIVRRALMIMFTEADVENGLKRQRETYINAYQEMAKALENNIQGTDDFINSFIENYKLDKIKDKVLESIEKEQDIINMVSKGKSKNGFNIRASMHARGGLAMEDFRTFIGNYIKENLNKVQMESQTSGRTGQKADVILSFDIPLGTIQNWMQNNDFGNREKDAKAIAELQKDLKKFNDGFVVYINSKNYSLNQSFEEGAVDSTGKVIKLPGFSAGEKVSMENFQKAAQAINMDYNQLIRRCIQLIPGAIGSTEQNKENLKLTLVDAIASALFDDFNTIGAPQTINGAKSVHLLDLDGVIIPISLYFWVLSQSFGQLSNLTPSELIEVQIETPDSILWPKPKDKAPNGLSQEYWDEQGKVALHSVKIGFQFLRKYRQVMKNIFEPQNAI